MRLIDATAFDAFDYDNRGYEFDSPSEAYDQGVEFVLNAIDEAPTIDALEVVRCKDCKHWIENADEFFETAICEITGRFVPLNGFCWRGDK